MLLPPILQTDALLSLLVIPRRGEVLRDVRILVLWLITGITIRTSELAE
jgi:hypothetical protein